jgi:HlyD family secretion protein
LRLTLDAAAGAALLLALVAAACSPPAESEANEAGSTPSASDDAAGIACLGRIEPHSRSRRLSAPYTELGPPILGELRVDTGDRVAAGDVVATLVSTPVREAAARQADRAVEVARRRLRVVASGEKAGTIEAQRAEVVRLEAELANAEVELERRRALHRDEVLSTTELDAFALVADQRRALLDAGRDLLDAVAEIRPADVELARAELDQAMVASERVRADYELTLVRSPIAGEVLAVNSRPGEVVGPDGIVEIGDLSRMIVVAEVYATDVAKVRVGAPAQITAEFLDEPVGGRVAKIGRVILPNETLDRDPSAFADRRVVEVEVEIDLDDAGEKLASLVHGEVRVRIGGS